VIIRIDDENDIQKLVLRSDLKPLMVDWLLLELKQERRRNGLLNLLFLGELKTRTIER